jgi:hypothetical protein
VNVQDLGTSIAKLIATLPGLACCLNLQYLSPLCSLLHMVMKLLEVKGTYQGMHNAHPHSSRESVDWWMSGTSCHLHNKVVSLILWNQTRFQSRNIQSNNILQNKRKPIKVTIFCKSSIKPHWKYTNKKQQNKSRKQGYYKGGENVDINRWCVFLV